MPLAIGQSVAAGRIALLGGAVELTLSNGVVIVLEGPGDLELRDELAAFLHAGSAVVRMPEGMSGFRLDTATTDVLDLGTEFAVKAAPGFVTDVQVFDGDDAFTVRLVDVSRGVAFGWSAAGIERRPAVGDRRRHRGITRRANRARSCGPVAMASWPTAGGGLRPPDHPRCSTRGARAAGLLRRAILPFSRC